jgi:Big-like domain-containing protein
VPVSPSRTAPWRTALALATILLAGLAPGPALADAPTDAPNVVSPAPGASVGGNPILDWDPVAGAIRYRVQVATSASFSTLVFNVDTYNTRATPSTDLPLGPLYWRVAGMDGSNNLGPYGSSNFTRNWGAAPVLTAPADDATLTFPDDPALLTWEPLAGARQYRVEVDDSSDFVGADTFSTNNTSLTLTQPQTVSQNFYWHVQGISGTAGVNSAWSVTRNYHFAWPDVPVLVSPPDTNLTSIQDVVLDWNPVVGAQDYQVQISPNGDWANNVAVDQVVFGTSYAHPQGLNNGSFFWRVRARDAKNPPNNGGWSEVWTFTRGWPQQPTLVAPANNNHNVTIPRFSWTPVIYAAHYELQIGTDQNFSPGTYTSCQTNHTEYTPYIIRIGGGEPTGVCAPLTPGTSYYWRVRGVDSPAKIDSNTNAFGIWSDTYLMTYKPAVPTQVAPADGASVVTPVLQWQAVPGHGRYRVTIKRADGNNATTGTTYALSWTPDNLNPADGPFKWTVQTIDPNGLLGILPNLSAWRSFSLVAPTWSTTWNMLTPADGGSSTRMPSMTWDPFSFDPGTPLDTADDIHADHYTIYYGIAGSGLRTTLAQNWKFAGYTSNGDNLPDGRSLGSGSYFWQVEAFTAAGASLGESPTPTFSITNFDVAAYTSPEKCVPTNAVCTKLPDTPTLEWQDVPLAGGYIVYVAKDANFTNGYREYSTFYPTLTPLESYLDNQAGQAYFWFVRPCLSGSLSPCGPFGSAQYANAFAFQKRSAALERLTPDPDVAVSFANEVTFSWRDYLATNGDLSNPAAQEARWYRVQVSAAADFATLLDDRFVDQTKFTSFDKTYPEGPIYWRVQAIDGSSNPLTFNTTASGTLTKASPKVVLSYPGAGATVQGLPYFRWTPQAFAAKYELQLASNGDTLFSSGNVIISGQQTKLSAWSPTSPLPAGDYAWRVRRLDVQDKSGPWSLPRTFTLELPAPTLVSPADDYNFLTNDLLFSWTGVQGAAQYRFQSSSSNTFSTLIENEPTVMTSYAPTRLYTDGRYYWRVQVLDAQNNVLSTSASRTFRKDNTIPIVTSKSPLTVAPITGAFSVVFSEAVTGVSATTFKMVLAGTVTAVAGTVATPSATTATLTPSAALMPGQSYTLSLSSAIEDLSGNSLVATSWTVRASTIVENTSSALIAVWDRDYSTSASGGAFSASRTGYSKKRFTFSGTNVTVLGRRAPDGGYARVYLDGVYQAQVSFYAAANQWKVPVWSKTGLADAAHTVEVLPLATKPTASTSTWVYVDAFQVGAVVTEELNAAVQDFFRRVLTSSASGGSYELSSHLASGDTAQKPYYQITFKGTGFNWYATRSVYGGTAAVYIDNVARATVNLYSATAAYKVKVYASPTLTNGVHTLRIYLNGTKSTTSKGYDVSLDWVAVR